MKLLTSAEFAAAAGIPRGTLRRWNVEKKFAPAQSNGKGKPAMYSESQIAEAVRLHNPPNKISADNGISLFETVQPDAPQNPDIDNLTIETLQDMEATDTEKTTQSEDTADTKDLQQLESEIRFYLKQTAQNIIEVGKRLIQAKNLVEYGKWQAWLEDNFQLSYQTAAKFIQCAEKFSNVVSIRGLSTPTKMIALLSLTAEEAEKFVEEKASEGKPVADMTTRELREEISQYKRKERSLPPIAHCHNETTEWYTPEKYIAAARRVLGDIDLDPASSPVANQTVQAAKIYTAENDGLNREWRGRIFLNPPYSKGQIESFAKKFCEEFDAGNVMSAIVLVDNATETQWFSWLVNRAAALCFTVGRINFIREGEETRGHHTRGQCFLYYGSDTEKFFGEFSQIGWPATIKNPAERRSFLK